jgi:hypothetical protein
MADFSLDVDGIKDEINNTFKEEEKKLQNSSLKTQAKSNADAIFESDLYNPVEREKIIKPLDNFGLSDMSKSAETNELLSTRFIEFSKGGEDANNIGEKLAQLEAEYTSEKGKLTKYFTTALLMDDTETQAELKEELAELEEWYAKEKDSLD